VDGTVMALASAYGDVGLAEGLGHVPATVLVCDDVFLISLVG
jgi:hypothetical protein